LKLAVFTVIVVTASPVEVVTTEVAVVVTVEAVAGQEIERRGKKQMK